MQAVFSAAGRAFLVAFGGALLVLLPGVLEAQNLDGAYALGVAALIAAISAGIVAVQEYVPKLSFGSLLGQYAQYGYILDAGVRAFAAALLVGLTGALNAPDLSTAKALAVSALIGAAAAALRAVRGAVTAGDVPAPERGV